MGEQVEVLVDRRVEEPPQPDPVLLLGRGRIRVLAAQPLQRIWPPRWVPGQPMSISLRIWTLAGVSTKESMTGVRSARSAAADGTALCSRLIAVHWASIRYSTRWMAWVRSWAGFIAAWVAVSSSQRSSRLPPA
ncbi:MAG: hypothetical protein HS111_08995 [Kofleriaceae bacterium]|nr:hypothetical protein [Kofleriaceae bacterium]